MKKIYLKYKESKFHKYVRTHKKYAPLLFFIAGFTWDSLTLGRIDRMYDLVVLSSHMVLLTLSLYLYNLSENEKPLLKIPAKYAVYLPLAIQFFLGGLSSAYVIYFARSVSLSKTAVFFFLLLLLFIANEFLRKRISNKYLQFGFYFFVNFIFLSCFIPIILKKMNSEIFYLSGFISLVFTLVLVYLVYKSSQTARVEIVRYKMITLILSIYVLINACYYFKLIPPVPLALDKGLIAYDIKIKNDKYLVTYEIDDWFYFWRDHKTDFNKSKREPVYVFTSVFAPTDLEKKIFHRWMWFNKTADDWQVMDEIGFNITGGRDNGYRGYSYKNNVLDGKWKVEVVTEENLVLGVVDFNINLQKNNDNSKLVTKDF